jgi:hypothetical protein
MEFTRSSPLKKENLSKLNSFHTTTLSFSTSLVKVHLCYQSILFSHKPATTEKYFLKCPRRWSRPTCSFCDTQTASFLEFSKPVSYCFVGWWFYTILGSKTTLHYYNWLGFSKLQDTKSFLFTWKRHVCTPLPPSGETGNYAIACHGKTFTFPLSVGMLLSLICGFATAQPSL